MNEFASAQINHCSISPRKESIPRVSNPRKAIADILDLCFCSECKPRDRYREQHTQNRGKIKDIRGSVTHTLKSTSTLAHYGLGGTYELALGSNVLNIQS